FKTCGCRVGGLFACPWIHQGASEASALTRGGMMAATFNCRDCGNVVSKRAKACPKCGRPNRNTLLRLVVISIATVLLFPFVLGALVVVVGRSASPAGSRSAARPD